MITTNILSRSATYTFRNLLVKHNVNGLEGYTWEDGEAYYRGELLLVDGITRKASDSEAKAIQAMYDLEFNAKH
jgi:hypothetical protein